MRIPPRFWPGNQRLAGRIPSCGVPLRGAKTQPGFHPFAKPSPILAGESAAGRQNAGWGRDE
ncbi:MAG: hypothetical protein LBK61_06650 [Spirochaetaceae bacterium]|nr:hypothetical protein [Spirochaetaceae bacterium]